jgi:hypothetical protein
MVLAMSSQVVAHAAYMIPYAAGEQLSCTWTASRACTTI